MSDNVDAEANVHMHIWAVSYAHHRTCVMPMITVGTLVFATGYGTAGRECMSCSNAANPKAPMIKSRQTLCISHAEAPWVLPLST